MTRAARHRISGSDAGFLYIEGERQTSTCTHTLVLGPPDPDRGALTRADLVDHLKARLDRTPVMRRRLEQVPFGVGHALLVDDPDFDLQAHVRHTRLPAPGDEAAFHDFMATQVPLRLPLDRALWQVTLLDGLAGGRQALVFAFHHTLADGAGLLAILSELIDDRTVGGPLLDSPRRRPAPTPSPAWLFVVTLLRELFVWMTLPLLTVRTVRRFKAVKARRAVAPVRVPDMSHDAPHSVLNLSADNERGYAHASLSLDTMRRVRGEAQTTLSDVVLAVIAGALRGYLGERDQLPSEPLVVSVPVGRDAPDAAARLGGNVFCNYYALLPTDEPDARTRLTRTAQYTAEAKHQLDIQGRDTLTTWLDRLPPAVADRGAKRMAAERRTSSEQPDFNLLVSNLKVPHDRWTMGGREVEEIILSGPVTEDAGLNITVVGYGDRVIFAVQTNPGAVDRADELAGRLHDGLDELVAACCGTAMGTIQTDTEGQVA